MRQFKQLPWIFLLPIFLISSCGSVHAPMESSFFTSSYEEEVPHSSSSNPPTTEEAQAYWNVDAIDVSEIDKQRKLIAFTFDDAPSRTLENILSVFVAFNEQNEDCKASATIFFNGDLFTEETPHLLYSACALGFELGNHTHSHYDLTTLDRQTLLSEIAQTDALLSKIDGLDYHLLRAPFGKTNELVQGVANTPIIDWTIDTLDWTGANETDIYNCVFNNRFPGAIVLMHDGYEGTVSALKRLLPDLKGDGYQVVSVSKMIKAHGCNFRKGKVYIRARKQN